MRQPLDDTIAYPAFLVGGLTLWGIGLFIVRGLGRAVESLGGMTLLFAVSLVSAGLIAFLVRTLSRPSRLVEGMAVVAMAGLLADAVLLPAFPFAYGPDERVVRYVMAWRVGTAAFLLLAGVLLEHRPIAKKTRKKR